MAESVGLSAPEPAARPVLVQALRVTLGRPPVWLTVLGLQLALAAPPAVLLLGWMRGVSEHRYAPGELFVNLDANFRFDQRAGLELLDGVAGELGAVLALLSMLLGCFCAGGWLQVFLERTHGESLRRFFLGGARYFWRFVRVWLLTLVTLACCGWLLHGWPWQQLVLRFLMDVPVEDFTRLETLQSGVTAAALRLTQAGLMGLLFALTMAWGDYARTRIALHDTSSAVWAGLCTWYTLLRHPLRTLRPMLGLILIEAGIVLSLGLFARSVEGDLARRPEAVGIAVLLLVNLLALLWRVVLRGARYHAAAQVSRAVVLPIARPDPWKHSLGGPGGPRYPIGEDEYAVSL